MLKLKFRFKIYFWLAVIPSLYWGGLCAIGLMFFHGVDRFGVVDGIGIIVSTLSLTGLVGLVWSLRSLWRIDKAKKRNLIVNALAYLGLSLYLGLFLKAGFPHNDYGLYLGWWLVAVAIISAVDCIVQYLKLRSNGLSQSS